MRNLCIITTLIGILQCYLSINVLHLHYAFKILWWDHQPLEVQHKNLFIQSLIILKDHNNYAGHRKLPSKRSVGWFVSWLHDPAQKSITILLENGRIQDITEHWHSFKWRMISVGFRKQKHLTFKWSYTQESRTGPTFPCY